MRALLMFLRKLRACASGGRFFKLPTTPEVVCACIRMAARLPRRALWKAPGETPVESRIRTSEDHLRGLIGSAFRTHTLDQGNYQSGSIVLICANQDTARAQGLGSHIWFPTGTIAGPVIIVRKRHRGDYLDLTDADVAAWSVKLMEFAERVDGVERPSPLTTQQEKAVLREHYARLALLYDDDLTAVIRLQVELEEQIRERLRATSKYPQYLSFARFELPQLASIAAAMGAIAGDSVDLIVRLGEIRNRFAHDPGFMPTAQDFKRLTDKAPTRMPYDDFDYIFLVSTDGAVDPAEIISHESLLIRGLYQSAIVDVRYRLDLEDEPRAYLP